MTLDGLIFPDDLLYLVEHDVWARPGAGAGAGGEVTVGITALGIRLSGEIYMCRPKPVGSDIAQGRAVAVVELAKAIVSVKSAVSGRVVAVNPRLADEPELIHRDPYGAGWIARLQWLAPDADRALLLDAEAARPALEQHARSFGDGDR
ncbi:MAG TPA: glycine cleavage system protein H [Burkholderiaceae bacterium]|nr:glycine cleavage system protein H [Burkholderiaceae bacterium]